MARISIEKSLGQLGGTAQRLRWKLRHLLPSLFSSRHERRGREGLGEKSGSLSLEAASRVTQNLVTVHRNPAHTS